MGLRHAALAVADLPRATAFYRDVLGFSLYWSGDDDWTMLRWGSTSVSLVLAPAAARNQPTDGSHPAHLGLTFDSPQNVDAFHRKLTAAKVGVVARPRWHRDKSYGFYFQDTEGNNLEAIFIPVVPIVGPEAVASSRALVLVIDGASDRAARRPFERLVADCRRHFPHTRIELAFHGHGEPTVEGALESLFTDDTVTEAVVVPLFVSGDLSPSVDAFREKAPGRRVVIAAPAAEHEFFRHGLLETIAESLATHFG